MRVKTLRIGAAAGAACLTTVSHHKTAHCIAPAGDQTRCRRTCKFTQHSIAWRVGRKRLCNNDMAAGQLVGLDMDPKP